MGRKRTPKVRRLAQEQGWLDPYQPLPEGDLLAQSFTQPSPRAQTTSQVLPHEEEVRDWRKQADVHTGEIYSTWIFVMVMAWSRHMYAEIVRDQKVPT